jgi:ABC-type transport system substrate-binding protein
VAAAILPLLAVLGTGCPGPDPAADAGAASEPTLAPKAEKPRVVRIPLEAPLTSLDPAEAADAPTRRVIGLLFDQLVDWDPEAPPDAPRLQPELLAALPEISTDGLKVTMRVRIGEQAAKFAMNDCLEGGTRAVRASDVRASLLRHAEPKERRAYGMLAGRIAGFDAWAADHEAAPEPAITADDATGVVEIELTRPQPELPGMLANPQLSIVPAECPDYWDGFDRLPFRGNPVGSGPYMVDQPRSMIPKQVTLVRNPAHRVAPPLAEIQLEHVRSPETALRLFQHDELALVAPGQSQFAEVFEGETLREGAVPSGTRVVRGPVAATTLLMFDLRDDVVGKGARGRAVRRAVSLAFDAATYRRIVRNDAWSHPAARLVPPGIDGSTGQALHPFAPPAPDLERARKELRAAGVTGSLTLHYATSDDEAARQEAAILAEALRPLDITLEVHHEARYQELLADPDQPLRAQMFALRWDFDYPSAENVLRAFTCIGDLSALAHHCDAEYDRRFSRFAALPDGPERAAAIEDLERFLGERAIARPVDHPEAWLLVQPWLSNVVRHPFSGLRLELAHL